MNSKYGEVSCLRRSMYHSGSSNITIFEGNKEKFSFCKCSTSLHSASHIFSDHLQELQFTRVLLWLIKCYQVYLWLKYCASRYICSTSILTRRLAGTVNLIGQYHWHILLCSHPGFSSSQMVWLLSTIWRHVCSTDFLLCLTYKTSCSFRIWWMICDLEYRHGLEVCSAHNQKICSLSQSLKI